MTGEEKTEYTKNYNGGQRNGCPLFFCFFRGYHFDGVILILSGFVCFSVSLSTSTKTRQETAKNRLILVYSQIFPYYKPTNATTSDILRHRNQTHSHRQTADTGQTATAQQAPTNAPKPPTVATSQPPSNAAGHRKTANFLLTV